ncbi:MAG: MobA/MobL family protein [Oscillospiraceae bacterium]|nr:MobA/MobL family protein [Oscillospiraceae bacterium]
MAIYHLEAKVISRGTGRSACAASAYMSCSAIYNDYDGVQHDYTRKQGLVWSNVFLPDCAPVEWQDRAVLWNSVEEAEKTKDSRLAREFVVALPVELGKLDWINLLSKFIYQQFVNEGMCADVAIHDTDGHNPHAHILLTVRPLNENGTWQYKTEKEYLCAKDGEERGFTAAEFKDAQKDGWEKQYLYKVGKKKEYMAPSVAEAQGLERTSKHPKSTKYGRQNPISERWNSEEQLVLWREAWANAVNHSLERYGFDERVDHRSFAEQGRDEQPTIHEGVAARALEKKGIVSDRCELNRQIRRDNALLREIKAQVKKLLEAVKNTIPALAEAMESVREKMIIFKYQLGYILSGKRRLTKSLDVMKPELEHYTRIAGQIREKSKERNTLLAEKKKIPALNIIKHRDLSRRIAELTEELEELRSEKKQLLAMLDYVEDTTLSAVKMDVSAMEANLAKLEQQEQKYTAELDAALAEYSELKAQAADFDSDELAMAQLEIRPQKEASAESKIQAAYGDKYDFWTMIGAKRDVAELLGEEEPRSIRERLRRKELEKERINQARQPERKKQKDRGWER